MATKLKLFFALFFTLLYSSAYAQLYYGPFTANGSNLPPGAVTQNYNRATTINNTLKVVKAINGKNISLTNGITSVTGNFTSTLTAGNNVVLSSVPISRALVINSSHIVTASVVTSTELGYVSGVTSSIQTQLDSKSTTATLNNYAKKGNNSDITALLSGNIGIGTSSPTAKLDVSGSLNCTQSGIFATNLITNGGFSVSGQSNFGVAGKIQTTNGIMNFQGLESLLSSGNMRFQTKRFTISPWVSGSTYREKMRVELSGVTINTGLVVTGNITNNSLTASRVLVSDSNKVLISSSVTSTELGYVSGVTASIQTQLNDKQPLDSELTAISGLTSAANKLPYFTGSGTAAVTDFSSNGRSFIAASSTASMKTLLNLNNVENTALSTWGGSGNLTTIGTLSAPLAIVTTSFSELNSFLVRGNGAISEIWQPNYSGGTKYNWRLEANRLYDQSFSIVPSTTAGGDTYTTPAISILAPSGNVGIGKSPSYKLDVNGNERVNHIIGGTSAPSTSAGSGAGTGPTITLGSNSNDLCGVINVTTGTLPSGSNAVIVTITFNSASYTDAPVVSITPANAVTALLSGATMIYPTSTTTTFVLNSGATGLTASTAYAWNYHILGGL